MNIHTDRQGRTLYRIATTLWPNGEVKPDQNNRQERIKPGYQYLAGRMTRFQIDRTVGNHNPITLLGFISHDDDGTYIYRPQHLERDLAEVARIWSEHTAHPHHPAPVPSDDADALSAIMDHMAHCLHAYSGMVDEDLVIQHLSDLGGADRRTLLETPSANATTHQTAGGTVWTIRDRAGNVTTRPGNPDARIHVPTDLPTYARLNCIHTSDPEMETRLRAASLEESCRQANIKPPRTDMMDAIHRDGAVSDAHAAELRRFMELNSNLTYLVGETLLLLEAAGQIGDAGNPAHAKPVSG